ncbi:MULTISPECIES: hypothetical protein [unclassified Streptomyces]|uniref:hypothetical protein n=1 Tax=unclassified Streptomyces TaxID=2593676 RepID=UPI0038195D92
MVSEWVDPAATAWAEEKQRNEFACFARPVMTDLSHGHAGLFRGRLLIGAGYASRLIEKGGRRFPQQV